MGHRFDAGKITAFRKIASRFAAGAPAHAEPVDPMLGGLKVGTWFNIFYDTHCAIGMGGLVRVEWPEPGGYADQPAVVVTALSEVRQAVMKEAQPGGI